MQETGMALIVKEHKGGRGEAAWAVEEEDKEVEMDKEVERVEARRLLIVLMQQEVVALPSGENI